MTRSETHVVPNTRSGWDVVRSGASARDSAHETKKDAIARARDLVLQSGGGEVVIHGRDGTIQESETIGEPARRPRRAAHALS
jgi:hypothetical protein